MRKDRPSRGSQKKTALLITEAHIQDREADTFKKRPCGPVLKDRQQKPKAPGAPRGWVTASLVTGRGLSLRTDAKKDGKRSVLF